MLTNMKIERLKPESKIKRYSDRDGLALEVRPSGNKIFIFRFQWAKKPQTITLGRYPSLCLADARQMVSLHRISLNNHVDPRKKAHDENHTTFKTIAEQWYGKNSQCWRERTQQKHKRSLERDVYPVIGNRLINGLTKAHLLQVIYPHESRGHHEIAHRLHDQLKAIFDFCNCFWFYGL